MLGGGRVNACKEREKVGLELLNGTFSDISAMDIQRDELKLGVPLLLNNTPVVSTGFIVEDL